MLEAIDWNSLFQSADINICWSHWRTKFLQVMEACIPQPVLKARKNLPWHNKSVIQTMRKRNSYFRVAKRTKLMIAPSGTSTSPIEIKLWKCWDCTSSNIFTSCNSQTKRTSIKVLSKQDSTIPTLREDNNPIITNSGKADVLNNFFQDCFNRSFPPLEDPTSPVNDPSNCPESVL